LDCVSSKNGREQKLSRVPAKARAIRLSLREARIEVCLSTIRYVLKYWQCNIPDYELLIVSRVSLLWGHRTPPYVETFQHKQIQKQVQ